MSAFEDLAKEVGREMRRRDRIKVAKQFRDFSKIKPRPLMKAIQSDVATLAKSIQTMSDNLKPTPAQAVAAKRAQLAAIERRANEAAAAGEMSSLEGAEFDIKFAKALSHLRDEEQKLGLS